MLTENTGYDANRKKKTKSAKQQKLHRYEKGKNTHCIHTLSVLWSTYLVLVEEEEEDKEDKEDVGGIALGGSTLLADENSCKTSAFLRYENREKKRHDVIMKLNWLYVASVRQHNTCETLPFQVRYRTNRCRSWGVHASIVSLQQGIKNRPKGMVV